MNVEARRTKSWLERASASIALYREALLRQVALKLIRPRTQYTSEELHERMMDALDDPVSIDRTLKTVSPVARRLLRLIDISKQPQWRVQSLVDMLPIIGHRDGIAPVVELLESGLLFPDLVAQLPVESIAAWLEQMNFDPISVFTVPLAASRCRTETLTLEGPVGTKHKLNGIESDGLEWPLRTAVCWQVVRTGSLRQTQNGGLFKRDQDRLRSVNILATPPADSHVAAEDVALLTAELARSLGILTKIQDEWLAGDLPNAWTSDAQMALPHFWSALNGLTTWDPSLGYDPDLLRRKWLGVLSVALAAALLETPSTNWLTAQELANWLAERQPEAAKDIDDLNEWCSRYLFGVLQPLRMIQVAQDENALQVRLSPAGRDILLSNERKPASPEITQTLLVQPNLEVIVYRQGLTPELIAQLTRLAEWKLLGLACTLTLTPESVYRGLESGNSLADIQRLLSRHSSRPLSDSVLETLRSWASKRERVQVYPAAIVLEFRTAADLEMAIGQGLVEQKLGDRIAVVPSESKLDYSRFRLVGSRDYLDPEDRCIEAEPDGLTLVVADGKSDLLLATELQQFSNPTESNGDERPRYQISVDSLRRARGNGIDIRWLEDWFHRRSGFPVPATAKLLFQGSSAGNLLIDSTVILRTQSPEVADGIERWPATKEFVIERIGPTSFIVRADKVDELRHVLTEAGLQC